MTLNQCLENFSSIGRSLGSFNYPKFRELASNCEKLNDSVILVSKFAHQYDFQGLQVNGYRSYVKIIAKFSKIVKHTLDQRTVTSDDLNRLITVSRCFVTYLDHINDLRYLLVLQEKGEMPIRPGRNHRFLSLTPPPMYQTIEFYHTFRSESQELSILFGYYNSFWLCPSAQRCWSTFSLLMAVLYSLPFSLSSIWDRSARGYYIMETLRNSTVSHPFGCWNITEFWVYKKFFVNLYHLRTPAKSTTIYVPLQRTWIIPEHGGRVELETSSPLISGHQGRHIRCRYIQHSTIKPGSKVVLHAHGGAFLVHSPDSHELYLRSWVSGLQGVPIISVDYSLKEKYPVALQELLDVYLWLVSGHSSVLSALGFTPTEVILTGDSSGALLTLGLSLVLNDIRAIPSGSKVIFPKGYVGSYMGFTSTAVTPSKLIGKIDPIVNIGPLLTSIGVYAEKIVYDHECDSLDSNSYDEAKLSLGPIKISRSSFLIKTITSLIRFITIPPWSRRPWHSCDRHKLESRVRKIFAKVDTPYSSPIDFGDLSSISDLPIYLIVGEFDMLLDDNIDLAKKWKGPIKLDVVEGLGHGFLNWILFSKECNEASQLVAKRIRESLEL